MPVQTSPTMSAVLSKRLLSAINGALHKVDAAFTECDLAEQCGNNCTERRDNLEQARTQLNEFKKYYFPDAK